MGAKPFSMLQEMYFIQYQQQLSAFQGYQPPLKKALAMTLLDEIYAEVVKKKFLIMDKPDTSS